jgi:hypothetical protein
VNLLGHNIHSVTKQTETLNDAGMEVGFEIIVEKSTYLSLSRHQNPDQNRAIKIANRSFESVSQFKHFGRTVTNQNLTQDKIKTKLISGNTYYHPVKNLASSRLLRKLYKLEYTVL